MPSFIRVVEIWVPDAAGTRLALSTGSYGELSAFAHESEEVTFARGEGLPGLAWQAAMPIVMRDLNDASFLRAGAARDAGLTSGVAMPIIQGHTLRAVLVFLCGNHGHGDGAIEIWKDDEHSGQSLIDGYYGNLQRFERQSRNIKFTRGWGLPGMVWQSAAPVIADVSNTNAFLRSQAAMEAGISIGIGIPLNSDHNVDDIGFVVTFLSVHSMPIARRFEVWTVGDEGDSLYFEAGVDEQPGALIAPRDLWRTVASGEGILGKTLASGLPCIEAAPPGAAGERELAILAIPVYFLDRLCSVVSFCY